MRIHSKFLMPGIAGLIFLLCPALVEAQHYYVPAQPAYQQSVSQGYVVVSTPHVQQQTFAPVQYTLAYDQAGRAWYVPVQQTAVSPAYTRAGHYHSHRRSLAPGIRGARHAAADVADVVLTLHPGAWLAEELGFINRDRVVDRIRGHRHHHHH